MNTMQILRDIEPGFYVALGLSAYCLVSLIIEKWRAGR